MRTVKEPSDDLQARLFEDDQVAWWATQLSPNALRRLESGWQGMFRRSVLKLLPAEQLAEHFSADQGRPSKELYSMAGLMLIAEFKNLTGEETAEAYTFDASIQYALNLPRDRQYLSPRSVDNYRKLFREDDLAQEVFVKVSAALVEELELDIKRQRLDSTHVHSYMAQLGRQQLLAVGVKRFLIQLEKHHGESYGQLDEELRQRYSPAESRLFGQGTRKAQSKAEVIARIGRDMSTLVERFEEQKPIGEMRSYQDLKRLFEEHFEEDEGKPKSGGDEGPKARRSSKDAQGGSTRTLQNPSDPDAGYDGKKGSGYQAQITQALPPVDEDGQQEGPGLITGLVAQSAAVRDNEALPEVLEQQEQSGLGAEEMTADTLYGSDANVQHCAARGVNLISPVGGVPPSKEEPKHKCSRKERECKERLAKRREQQEGAEWKKRYAKRSGIEGINRALDMVTGFKQLRVRGLKAVNMALSLKATGWNILSAARIKVHRERKGRFSALCTRGGGLKCQSWVTFTLRTAALCAKFGCKPRTCPIPC